MLIVQTLFAENRKLINARLIRTVVVFVVVSVVVVAGSFADSVCGKRGEIDLLYVGCAVRPGGRSEQLVVVLIIVVVGCADTVC